MAESQNFTRGIEIEKKALRVEHLSPDFGERR